MLFTTWTFAAFFAIVLPLYWVLNHRNQNRMLLAASYLFYGWWDWRFLPLLMGSTLMDFYLGNLVSRVKRLRDKRICVAFSVVVNLALLGVFKYYGFFSKELASLFQSLGIPVSFPVLDLILPVGISFYTFQSMSYVLDISRGVTTPARSFWDFALYVSFFPHLVAGPIMRSGAKGQDTANKGLLKQVMAPRFFRSDDFQQGLYFIVLGFFKKVAIGDNLASFVNAIFSTNPSQLSGAECLAGIYAFAIQIYADFSGYSSIAQGIAKWMGFDLMTNFRQPYLAISPSDFWRRWHISLSTWLRDYVYISLGGSKGSSLLTYRNLLLTMVLGGIWHGANWTFILWGLYHGLILCLYRAATPNAQGKTLHDYGWASACLRIVAMFHVTCFGWLLFRADSVHQVWTMLVRIATNFQMTPFALTTFSSILFYAGPLMLFETWLELRRDMTALIRLQWAPRAIAYAYCVTMLAFLPPPVLHEFIYFQF